MSQYNLQVEILKELKEQMMDNPSLFTAGLLVSQTELALDMQTKIYDDKINVIMKDSNILKEKLEHRYQLIDWIEAIPELIANYSIIKNGNFINIKIERVKNSSKYTEFPYMKKGSQYQYAGNQYECTSFEHKLIDNVATVILLLTKIEKGEKNV